jgi:hypothetical protein
MRRVIMPISPALLPVKPDLNYWHDPMLKSCYPGSGTSCFDLSGSEYDGTLINTPTFSTDVGGCFDFNGTTQYIDTNHYEMLAGAGSFSIELWMKPDNTTAIRPIFSSWVGGAYSIAMLRLYNNQLNFYYYKNGVGQYGGATQAFTNITTWSHIVGVYNGSSLKTYVNGTQSSIVFSATGSTPNSSSSESFRIGRYGTSPAYGFDGKISSVKTYRRALSTTEITYNYNSQKVRHGL